MNRRAYQDQAFWGNKKLRRYLLMWLRQGGKTTTLANQAMLEMGENKNRLVTFVSASLNIGSEFVEKEAQSWSTMLEEFRTWAKQKDMQLVAGERSSEDSDSWKQMPEDVNLDDIANALEKSKFEVRLKHSETVYSRTKVIAPNIATARSWSGSVKFDEVAFVRGLRDLLAELEPIFATDPTFTFIMATTPPPDFAHYAYELMTPDDGTEEWEPNAEGNWFKNRGGLYVHRVSIDDAALAGRKIYDPETGDDQTPDEARETSLDKEGWDRSNRLTRPLTGTGALTPQDIEAAQRRGRHSCYASEWPIDYSWIDNIGSGPLALGVDPATTEGKKSNPTGFAVVEESGVEYITRMLTWYKIANPAEARYRIKEVVDALIARGFKNRIRGLSVDASNETYWSTDLKSELDIPVILTSGSEKSEYRGESTNFKTFSCSVVADAAESQRLTLPDHRYVREDFGRMIKSSGKFHAPVGPNGEHADTFDAVRQATSLLQGSGPVEIAGVPVGEVAKWGQQKQVSDNDPWWRNAGDQVRKLLS